MWKFVGDAGFGLTGVKREGQKFDIPTYLYFYGKYPPKDFYTESERQQLKQDGWEWSDD